MTALPSTYEPIMNALAALLEASLSPAPFRYVSRRFVTWETLVNSVQNGAPTFPQPALLLYDGIGFGGGKTKIEQRGRGVPPVRILFRTIIVYAQLPGGGTPQGPDDTTPGGTVLGPLSEAIEGVFGQFDGQGATLTLGGLVRHCWIEGDSHWLTGDLDPQGQSMMTIPVQIMIP